MSYIEALTTQQIQEVQEFASEEQPLARLVDAFAPSLHGLEIEKRAVILQLFSGVTRVRRDGLRLRGDIHILLDAAISSGEAVE